MSLLNSFRDLQITLSSSVWVLPMHLKVNPSRHLAKDLWALLSAEKETNSYKTKVQEAEWKFQLESAL